MTPTTPDPSVAALDVLVGEWVCEAANPLEPGTTMSDTTTYEWMDGGRFLIERSTADPPFPSSLSLIGREDPDDPSSRLVKHYFDSRGVARLYGMTLEDDVWTLTRDDADFSQRYRGTFSADRKTITGAWERSDGKGQPLHHDFELTYRKVK
ncbi:MAG TPA: hypothetical protein VGM69_06885 [Chloroflexota bacterium]|jgi:hypothetical protein